MAASSLSLTLRGTSEPETAKKWFERLVWAQLPVGETQLWWPALRFVSVAEFDRENEEEAAGNFEYRIDLAVCLMDKMQAEDKLVQVVRFLGRPLGDVQPVHENEVLDFIGHMNTQPAIFNPDHFIALLGHEKAKPLYEDFHRGMDDFAKILYQLRPRPHNFEPWINKAQRVWEQKQPTMSANAGAPTNSSSSQRDSLRQAQSPNHSIAAVSVAEESLVPNTANQAPTSPRSRVATSKIHNYSQQGPPKSGRKLDYAKFPSLDPLGLITWKEARVQLTCAGWTKVKNTGQELYQPYPKGPALNLDEVQQICKDIYGWKQLPEVGPQNPLPSREVTNPQQYVPESNAKNYSFRFLWKHKCQPEGWTRVRPPRGVAAHVDYYYLRPGVTRQKLGIKNVDYFEDHYSVLDWCRRHNYYPTVGWTSGDESSVATEVADDPSTYLEETQAQQEKGKKKSNKPKKSKKNTRNYSFGVLWASYLEPNGWTMPKAKRNLLTDYYYVRPGRSVKEGKLNIDYFATTEAVLDYCAKHNDYPESSGASSGSPDDGTIATGADASTFANGGSTDGESTKFPDETDDDETKHAGEDDDDTLGEFSTPGTKTQPQDPGKPLLRDDDDDKTPEDDEELTYHWRNLWPILEKQRGWGCIRAKNEFEDWWYLRPRKLRLDGEEHEMVKGVDYFTTQEEVIAYCKKVDREDNLIRLKAKKKNHENQSTKQPLRDVKPQSAKHTKANQPKMNQQKPKKSSRKAQKARKVTDICVLVDSANNTTAPWVKSPLPKNIYNVVSTVGGIRYISRQYYLHNETNKNFSFRFEDISDLLKHLCQLGRGNFYIDPGAKNDQKDLFLRLINYAFVPGSTLEHRKLRPLNRDEIVLCLTELFHFSCIHGQWHVPDFLRKHDDTFVKQGTGTTLKSTYTSLSELLRALRAIENLEGSELGRRRKTVDKKTTIDQRELLIMAFRLSIAEDEILDSFEGELGAGMTKSNLQVNNQMNTENIHPNEMGCVDDSKLSHKVTHSSLKTNKIPSITSKSKKRGSPDSTSNHVRKKSKSTKKSEIEDLKVKWKGDPQDNPAPWVAVLPRDFASIKLVGVSYLSGFYYLPNESFSNFSARFTSVDEVFTHFCTYGNYNLTHLDKITRSELKLHIALGNVPGLLSTWSKYRLLETVDAIAILGVLGFREKHDKGWLVPEILLQETNPYQKGNPPLINPYYSSLDKLRIALRSLPELEVQPGGRRRRNDSKLNEHQTIAFRLWLAAGPEGPDDTTYSWHDADETAETRSRLSNDTMSNADDAKDDVMQMELTNTTVTDSANLLKETQCPSQEDSKDIAMMATDGETEKVDKSADSCEEIPKESLELIPPVDRLNSHDGISNEEPSGTSGQDGVSCTGVAQTLPVGETNIASIEENPNTTDAELNTTAPSNSEENAMNIEDDCPVGEQSESRSHGPVDQIDFAMGESKDDSLYCETLLRTPNNNQSHVLLTQPANDSVMSDESEDDEDATFINYGTNEPSHKSPVRGNVEGNGLVFSIQKAEWNERYHCPWLTQSYDDEP